MNKASEQAIQELDKFLNQMMPAIQPPFKSVMNYSYNDYADKLKKYLVRFSDSEFSEEKINQIPLGITESGKMHSEPGQRSANFRIMGKIVEELQAYIREKDVFVEIVIDPIGTEQISIDGYRILLKCEQKNRAALLAIAKDVKNELCSKEDEIERLQKSITDTKNTLHFTHKSHAQVDEMVKEVERKSADELATAKSELEVVRNDFSKFKDDIQKKELTASSAEFRKHADSSKTLANKWMVGVFASIALVIIALLIMVFSDNKELFNIAADISGKAKGLNSILVEKLTMIEVVKKITTKIVLFSMVIYLVSFLVKNYNAQMHNHIVNAQKANALRSTVELIGTAKEDEGNDKIILQATQAIFTTQKSGYQGADSEPTSPSVITNVIEAVSGGKKAS